MKSTDEIIDLRPSDTSESLTAPPPPPPPFVENPNQELIFQSVVKETAVIDTEPVYLTCDQSQAGSSYDDIAQLQETDERKEVAEVEDEAEEQEDKVVLEDGINKNNFFHSIGLDGGFGKPEYLTTNDATDTIFEERSMEEAADDEQPDEESEEANDDFEVRIKSLKAACLLPQFQTFQSSPNENGTESVDQKKVDDITQLFGKCFDIQASSSIGLHNLISDPSRPMKRKTSLSALKLSRMMTTRKVSQRCGSMRQRKLSRCMNRMRQVLVLIRCPVLKPL